MTVTVGIPQALLYYEYHPFWRTFFEELGAEVIVSPPTTKAILDQGVQWTVDETCLPVKIFHGHVMELRNRVDYLFVPRIISVEKRKYLCPKFFGLPDMVRHNLPGLPPIIESKIDLRRNDRQLYAAIMETGSLFTANAFKIYRAFQAASTAWKKYINSLQQKWGENGSLRIGVLGHGYLVYDQYISMNLLNKFKTMGIIAVTAEMLETTLIYQAVRNLPKDLYWTLGRRLLGAGLYFLQHRNVDGLIYVSAFGCGPDSLVGELVERKARRNATIPYMLLTLDEHTGEAGLTTRLEAFIDMIKWRKAQ